MSIILRETRYLKGVIHILTTEQMEFIMNESTTLSGIYLRGGAYKQAVLNGIKGNVSITGVTEEYSTVSKLNIIQGI